MSAVADLSEQVYDLLLDRAARLADVIGGPDLRAHLERHVVENTRAVVAQLRSGTEHEVAARAADLYVLAHGDSQPTPEWWRTPLGQIVARSIEPDWTEAVPPRVAARMIGVHESNVYKLRDRGLLARHPDGGVTRASVLALINERAA